MVAAGTLRQGVWNDEDRGRRIACILGASSPDVKRVEDVDCAALCMPHWLAKLTTILFDGVPEEQASVYALRYAEIAERWCVLGAAAWGRVSVTFKVACIVQALEIAEAAQPKPRPGHWGGVKAACKAMIAALKSGDAADAAYAARAAHAAADEADAAYGARADHAAAWAASVAREAWAADLFDVLLDAIKTEIGGVGRA